MSDNISNEKKQDTSLQTWPEKIFLVHGCDSTIPVFRECREVTWCEDQQFNGDIKYVRHDLAASLASDVDMNAELAAWREFAAAEDIFMRTTVLDGPDANATAKQRFERAIAALKPYKLAALNAARVK